MPEQLRTFMELRMAAMFWIHFKQNICHDAMNCDPSNVSYISDFKEHAVLKIGKELGVIA